MPPMPGASGSACAASWPATPRRCRCWWGLGVDELSVSLRQVPMVKARLRELTLDEARRHAATALEQATSEAVREALEAL